MPVLINECDIKLVKEQAQHIIDHNIQEPIVIQTSNDAYVIKALRREQGRTWREYTSAILCSIIFRNKVSAKLLRTGNIEHEAHRLKELHHAGIKVPYVFLQTKEYIVMEYCGESVEYILRRTIDKTPLLYKIVNNLVQLHSVNQWHGGAQIRNLTLHNNELYRIDFEENTGNAMPLAMAQAYDVLLCFNSLSSHIVGNQDIGPKLLTHYLNEINNVEIEKYLSTAKKYLQKIQALTPLMTKRMRNKSDIQQTICFINILKSCIK